MNREILRLAVPNILSNISVPLLSTVDTALMGRLTELHLGAVGLGAMIFNFIYWNFGFLRMGTTGMAAQGYGADDAKAIAATLGRALLVALILAGLILLFQRPLAELSFRLLNVTEAQLPLVREYVFIRIWAAPATLGTYVLFGWLFGMQNAIYPLVLTVFSNLVNMLLSWYLVHERGMETAGVAYGTLIAQYAGFLLAAGLVAYKYRDYLRMIHLKLLLQWQALRQFLSVNSDLFIRTFCLTFSFGFFYSRSALDGAMVLAVNVILLQFLNWMSYGVDGFAYAAESLVGKYAGKKDQAQTMAMIRRSFVWGMGLAAFYTLLYGLAGNPLLRIFTDQPDVITAAQPFLFWMALFPLLSTPCYIWDGIFIGLVASKAMRNSMILALAVFLLAYYPLQSQWGNHGLWAALLIFMIARGAIMQWVFDREKMVGGAG
ncbi:MATE family efflux transporter [Flavilitoribacter nigricans]|uniref:MATE family efflux transporter n=1 Tax=Flavilitoribacter nigricans (strain ATCC 23147 / DSM 23189 / NBRC 102662 / NCIMB 1420 / SS-2) TaxID=1122177 RepID=A0A2D0NGT4_FLAN2|nr:MATE family efflux transporter [Flavilitoribacter nigricans]PHN07596.1 MATE family efflux transporter [Flavilitoribacter nigricans DSM 23189 = NBRC 102662]